MLQSGAVGPASAAAATAASVPRPTELFYSKLNPLLKERVMSCLTSYFTTFWELDITFFYSFYFKDWSNSVSKPAKQVWYWASCVYKSRMTKFRVYVCMYVCVSNYSSKTTEPICIEIIPANRASYADCYRLLCFEIFTKFDELFSWERCTLHRRIFANGNVLRDVIVVISVTKRHLDDRFNRLCMSPN